MFFGDLFMKYFCEIPFIYQFHSSFFCKVIIILKFCTCYLRVLLKMVDNCKLFLKEFNLYFILKKLKITHKYLDFLAEKVASQLAERNYQLEVTALQVNQLRFRLKMLQEILRKKHLICFRKSKAKDQKCQ